MSFLQSLISPDEPGIVQDLDNLRYHLAVGAGAYGNVHSAVYRDQAVAIKRYEKDVPESTIDREIEIMRAMKGEFHVVQFLGRFVDEAGRNCVAMELAYNLSLRMLLETTGLGLSQNLKIRIARDVCRSLECLHKKGIAHEDIKSENVLLDFGLRAKLCDFGTAKFQGEEFSGKTGTPKYRAPERMAAEPGQAYDRVRSDIYSLGIVLEEVFGRIPIVERCLAANPIERPADCAEIFGGLPELNPDDDLGDRDFRGISAHSLGEADRINLAYYWTESMDALGEDLEKGRKLFYQGAYQEALAMFSSCESAVAGVFLGIMRWHGYGCQRDARAALELFEKCSSDGQISENSLTLSLVEHYLATIRISVLGKTDEIKNLFKLSNLGNAFAQVELSNVFSSGTGLAGPVLQFSPLATGPSKNVLDLLHNAAKTGYAHAQAMLSLFYISVNETSTIPRKEREYLQRSVEAGSLVGKILLDFVSDTIDIPKLKNTRNGALIEFVADLHHLTGKPGVSFECYLAAAKLGRKSSEWAMATIMKQTTKYLPAAITILKRLMGMGFNSLVNDDCYFFRMNRHRTTVEYELVEILMKQGSEEEAMNIVVSSSDTSSKAMELLFRLCTRAGESWEDLLTDKRPLMSADVMTMIAAMYKDCPCPDALRHRHRDKAMEWFEEAVKRGSLGALSDLAMLSFFEGNTAIASDLWRRGLEAEDPIVMLQMAIYVKDGKVRRKELLERAVARNEPLAMFELGGMLKSEGKLDEAERMLRDALLYGVERAAMELTFLIVRKQGRFNAEAKYCFRRSLKNVHPRVLYKLGCGYEEEHDLFDLVSQSAHLLDSDSLLNMGMLCDAAAGGFHPSPEAYGFFSQAAHKHNYHAAQMCLRHCLALGDSVGASRWKELLESRGHTTEESVQLGTEWKQLLQPHPNPVQDYSHTTTSTIQETAAETQACKTLRFYHATITIICKYLIIPAFFILLFHCFYPMLHYMYQS